MNSIILDTPAQIARFALAATRGALRLEIAGMKRRGQSAYAQLKAMGYKGTKAEVLAKVNEDLAAMR